MDWEFGVFLGKLEAYTYVFKVFKLKTWFLGGNFNLRDIQKKNLAFFHFQFDPPLGHNIYLTNLIYAGVNIFCQNSFTSDKA